MCAIDGGDGCDVWRESTQVAAKRHRCECCRSWIEPGQLYFSVFSIYEGHASTSKGCLLCAFALTEFCDAHEVGLAPRGFFDHLNECVGEDEAPQWAPMLNAILARRAEAR